MPDTFDPAPSNQDPGRLLFTNDDLRALAASYPDIFRSLWSGVQQGGVNVLGVRGDLADNALQTGERLGRSVGLPDWWLEGIRPYAEGARRMVGPTAPELQQQVEGVTGEFYQPQTPYGRGVQNLGRNVTQMAATAPMLGGLKSLMEGLRARMKTP